MADHPLVGLGVAVTRGERGDGPLTRLLRERGANVLDWGTVAFGGPKDPQPLLDALGRIDGYDWICFSSPRAVNAVTSRVQSPPKNARSAAVGPSTAASLEQAGWPVHRVASGGSGEALVSEFEAHGDVEGATVLFPASEVARPVIPEGLEALGAQVESVTAYRLVTLPVDGSAVESALESGAVHMVTFASPSAMEALRSGLGPDLFRRLAKGLPAVALGPTTANALREAHWVSIVEAAAPDFEAMVDAAVQVARL
jgi:uroporphyrinogen-III synthase